MMLRIVLEDCGVDKSLQNELMQPTQLALTQQLLHCVIFVTSLKQSCTFPSAAVPTETTQNIL